MGITSALYSGVSGLNTNSQAMNVIGNNLANTNTVGFKGSRTVFSDLLSSSVFGSGGESQVGRGVGMSKVDSIFSQGTFETTASDTDLAIEGDSFFMLKTAGDNTTYYSRAGAFRFDESGYLVNPEGLRVQGKGYDANGDLIAGDAADVLVASSGLIPGKVTNTLTLNSNLDASTVAITYTPASSDYVAASSDYKAASSDYMPASTDYMPASTDYMPASSDYVPASTDYMPASTDYMPASSDYVPASSDYMAASTDYMAASTDYVAASTDYMAASTDYMAASTDYAAASTDYAPAVAGSATLGSMTITAATAGAAGNYTIAFVDATTGNTASLAGSTITITADFTNTAYTEQDIAGILSAGVPEVTVSGATAAAVNTVGATPSGFSLALGADQIGTAQVGTAQVGTAQVGTAQVGTAQVGTAEVGTPADGTAQVGTAGAGTPAIGTAEVGTPAVGTAAVGTAEVGTAAIGTAETGTAFDPADTTSYDYASSTQVYDTLGNPHLVTTYFRKDADATNAWDWYWSAEDGTGGSLGNAAGSAPSGQIVFDADGKIDTTITGNGTGAIAASALDWNNGSTNTGLALNFATTQFNNASKVISQTQDGYGSGSLTKATIDSSGAVIASYSNGQQEKIANITLAKFSNPNGLTLSGSNLFTSNTDSGTPQIGLPGPELGKVFTNSLEQSNVDMGKEFVSMITVQRGFQANSKIISTVDQMLGELIQLKQ